MTSCENYKEVLNFVSTFTKNPRVQVQVKDARGLPADFLKEHKNVNLAEAIYLHCRYRSKPRMGRYITLENLTNLNIPKSASFLKKETQRLKRIKEKEDETGVIVQVMSQYCGMRVHIDDAIINETKSFALVAEMFFMHYPSIGIGANGVDLFLRSLFESKVKHLLQKYQGDINDMLVFTPWHYSHKKLKEKTAGMFECLNAARAVSDQISDILRKAYADRRQYRKFSR
jgi:hypothetical protein